MTSRAGAPFLLLNRAGRWADFRLDGLELHADGSLTLLPLPAVTARSAVALADLGAPSGPAGLAVGPGGDVFVSDPVGNRVFRLDGCVGTLAPLPCRAGAGTGPADAAPTDPSAPNSPGDLAALAGPRGLLYHPTRPALVVADSGNDRVVLLDPETGHLLDVWGQARPGSAVLPGDAPGRFATPTALAAAPDGTLYVVDAGHRRVQKLDPRGTADPAFWATVLGQAGAPREPLDVAVGVLAGAVRVVVLDGYGPGAAAPGLVVLDPDGTVVARMALPWPGRWLGLALDGETLYVGENDRRVLVALRPDVARRAVAVLGVADGYAGPVAALARGGTGGLFAHPGDPTRPVALAVRGAHARYGRLVGGPFPNLSPRADQWHRLRLRLSRPDGTHARVAVWHSRDGTPPPAPPPADHTRDRFADAFATAPIEAVGPDDGPAWAAFPPDAAEGLIRGAPRDRLWVAVELVGDGTASPRLAQVRLDFDDESLLEHLPALYRQDDASRELMTRFLALFGGVFDDLDREIDRLPDLLDPDAAPTARLAWLAELVGLEPDGDCDEATTRQAVAGAFRAHGRRGTPAGLRSALRAGGIAAHVEEPIAHASWWILPADETDAEPDADAAAAHTSRLGLSTMLGPAEPGGAVLGTTATLDYSHLAAEGDGDLALFEDVAHQLIVQVYRGSRFDTGTLDRARRIVERERPAHTVSHVCTVEPVFALGYQATLGVDAIVGGPPLPTPARTPGEPGGRLVLGGPDPGRIGPASRVGQSTRLGVPGVSRSHPRSTGRGSRPEGAAAASLGEGTASPRHGPPPGGDAEADSAG